MKRFTFAITLAAAAAMAIPAAAGPGSQAGNQKGAKANQASFSGTLGQCRTIQISGEPDRHVIGKCRDKDGRVAVINFGREKDLQRSGARIKAGDQIQAIGLIGRLNGQPVLIVDRFRTGAQSAKAGKTAHDHKTAEDQKRQKMRSEARRGDQQRHGMRSEARRGDQQRQGMRSEARRGDQQRQGQKVHMFPGRVVDMRDVTLKGAGEKNRLIKVDIGRDKTAVVNLGTGEPLRGLNLKKGDRVVVHGVQGRMNDRPVIYATQIADVAVIEKPADRAKRASARQTRNIQRVPQFQGNR